MVLKKFDSGPISLVRMQIFVGFTETCNLQQDWVYIPSGRALVAAPVWVLSYINWLFGGTDLSKCVLFQYFPFPSILWSILRGQLCILSLCVLSLVQSILWYHLSFHCHHPLYAGGAFPSCALGVQARPPLSPEATRSFLSRNQRSRHHRGSYMSRLQRREECKKSKIIEEVCLPRPY